MAKQGLNMNSPTKAGSKLSIKTPSAHKKSAFAAKVVCCNKAEMWKVKRKG